MKNKYEQDEILLQEIKRDNQLVIKALYEKLWPPFKAFISKGLQLNQADVEDIYSKSFTIFYYNIQKEKLTTPLTGSLKSYLFSIGKNYLYHHRNSVYHKKEIQPGDIEIFEGTQFDNSIDEYYRLMRIKDLVEKLLNMLDPPCRELLRLSFIKGFSADAIKREMGFPSEGAVRQKQFFCLKKIRKLLKNYKPDL